MLANGTPWQPIVVPLRSPTTADLAADHVAVQDWVAGWQRAPRWIRLEFTRLGGRNFGVNEVPRRAWVDTPQALYDLLAVGADVLRLDPDTSPRATAALVRSAARNALVKALSGM